MKLLLTILIYLDFPEIDTKKSTAYLLNAVDMESILSVNKNRISLVVIVISTMSFH